MRLLEGLGKFADCVADLASVRKTPIGFLVRGGLLAWQANQHVVLVHSGGFHCSLLGNWEEKQQTNTNQPCHSVLEISTS
jgi:hypothetical protein